MKAVKKLVGLIIIGVICVLVLHPAITMGISLYLVVKTVEILLLWGLANLVSKLIFGVSIRAFLFDDNDD